MKKWVIEIEVDDMWVADGFDPDDRWVEEMMQRELSLAYGHEVGGRIISAPDRDDINELQGYPRDGKRH